MWALFGGAKWKTVNMSFFGKQFKKVRSENASELLSKLNLSEQILAMLRTQNSVTTFTKKDDGTLQYVIKSSEGAVVLDQVIHLAKEVDYRSPDGMDTKVKFDLEGEVLKSYMQLPDGKVVNMDRYFEGNGMKLELYIKGGDQKAIIYYELV